MNELEHAENQLWSPKQMNAPHQQQDRPASPDYNSEEHVVLNSDDLQPTSQLYSSSLYNNNQQDRRASRAHNHHKFVVVVGSYDKPITLGRGGANTIKIGRRNRNISRTHLSISYNQAKQQFELTVVGLNGACVDDVAYDQHAVVPLENESLIDVLGDQIQFREPAPQLPPPTAAATLKEQQKHQKQTTMVVDEMKNKEMSPEPENEQQEEAAKDRMDMDITVDKQMTAEKNDDKPVVHTEMSETSVDKDDELLEAQESHQEDAVVSMDINTTITTTTVELDEIKSIIANTTGKTDEVKKDELQVVKAAETAPEATKRKKTKEAKKMEEKPILQENNSTDLAQNEDKRQEDYSEVIIDALVFSRASSMPISDICSRILKANPAYAEHSREVWIERIRKVLKEKPFFGEIERKGKAADGSPVENLYYYNSELDPVEWRRATYTQVGRSARKCTLKDKQYFWKIPPKLGRHRSAYVPPPAHNNNTSNEHSATNPVAAKRQRSASSTNENSEPKKIKQ